MIFAALADGLRKRGALAEAQAVLADGLARFPAYVPGLLVAAAVCHEVGDTAGEEAALRAARVSDPGHPMVGEDPPAEPGDFETAGDDLVEIQAFGGEDEEHEETADIRLHPTDFDDDGPVLVTESLAALYHSQGHLDEAAAAYAQLVSRHPGDPGLAARHATVLNELAARRPLPFDARDSGGKSVAAWLATVAAARPVPADPVAGYDAFFEAPPAPVDATADFDAFQRWLKDLDR